MKITDKQREALKKIARGGYRLDPKGLQVRYLTTSTTIHRNTYISLARGGLVQIEPVWRTIELTDAGRASLEG